MPIFAPNRTGFGSWSTPTAFAWTNDKIETFLRHEVDFLNITLDGATAETFESIRVRLKLSQIEDNIRRLIKMRDERGMKFPKVRVGMIAIPQNIHEIDALLNKWKNVVDFVVWAGTQIDPEAWTRKAFLARLLRRRTPMH